MEPTSELRTPVPKRQLLVLAIIIFTEPMDLVFLYPFVYFMVEGFGVASNPNHIGFYVGILSAAFPASQFFTSFIWGHMSDRFGRKPTILMSVFGSALAMIAFGFSTSYAMALGLRILGGLLNGTMGIAKSIVAELTDKTNRSAGFSMIGFVTGLGFIIGPAIGGFLSDPADQYPKYFGDSEFFLKFPYVLPCIITASISITGSLIGFFTLEETLESKRKNVNINEKVVKEEDPKLSFKEIIKVLSSIEVIGCIAAYGMTCFATNTLDESFSIWAVSDSSDSGLEFSSSDVGLTLMWSGVVLLLSQIFLYPLFAKLAGPLWNYRIAILLSIPIFIGYPTLSYYITLENNGGNVKFLQTLLWIQLLFLVLVRTVCAVTAFTASMIMISNCVTYKYLGAVNGVGQMTASFFRATGPILTGTLWSLTLEAQLPFPFNHYFVFLVAASFCIIGFISSLFLPKTINEPKKLLKIDNSVEMDEKVNLISKKSIN